MKRKDIFSENYSGNHLIQETKKARILLYVLSAITVAMLLYIVLNFKAITVIIAATVAGIRW